MCQKPLIDIFHIILLIYLVFSQNLRFLRFEVDIYDLSAIPYNTKYNAKMTAVIRQVLYERQVSLFHISQQIENCDARSASIVISRKQCASRRDRVPDANTV